MLNERVVPYPFMAYPSEYLQSNDASRAALRALLANLTDAQYKIVLEGDWTVGSTLAHVALFDHRALNILQRWEREGVAPSPNDTDMMNAAVLPFLQALPPAEIARMAVEFADALDAKLAALPDRILDQFETTGGKPFNLSRAKHRSEHIEQITRALEL
jgi:hypothetical protein